MKAPIELVEGGTMPRRATEGAAGFDCYARVEVELQPMVPTKVPLGFKLGALEHARGVGPYEVALRGRSGLLTKHRILCPVGTIDQDYRGEVSAVLVYLGPDLSFTILAGARVAQLVYHPILLPVFHRVVLVDETARGEGGFGSTGH